MQQYYYKGILSDEVVIVDDKFHYLKNVVKININEEIILFNDDAKAIYFISSITKKEIVCLKKEKLDLKAINLNVDLAIGLLKKDNIELVIQKLTELGINKICLLNMKNNVVKFEGKNIDKKLKRYNDIAISASEQSKRDNISNVCYYDNLSSLDFENYDKVFILHEKADYNDSLYKKVQKCSKEDKILLIIGPEGGISLQEIQYLEDKGKKVSLGKNILRAETAAIIAAGLTINILEEDL